MTLWLSYKELTFKIDFMTLSYKELPLIDLMTLSYKEGSNCYKFHDSRLQVTMVLF
jgi:hypothetical protein